LAAAPEGDRLVEGNVPPLELRDDVVQLALELLERALLAHVRTSSTRASRAGRGPEAAPLSGRERSGAVRAGAAGRRRVALCSVRGARGRARAPALCRTRAAGGRGRGRRGA